MSFPLEMFSISKLRLVQGLRSDIVKIINYILREINFQNKQFQTGATFHCEIIVRWYSLLLLPFEQLFAFFLYDTFINAYGRHGNKQVNKSLDNF